MHAFSDPSTKHCPDLACIARVHDYLRGGAHNFPYDRHYADAHPEATRIVRELLRREHAFPNLGSGLPAQDSALDALAHVRPEAQAVHADIDPAVIEHGRQIAGERTHFHQADATRPDEVLVPPIVADTLELHRPIGLLAIGLAHLLPDSARALSILPSYGEILAKGSALAVTHLAPWFASRFTPSATPLIAGPRGSVHPRRRRRAAQMFTGVHRLRPRKARPDLVGTPGHHDSDRAGSKP